MTAMRSGKALTLVGLLLCLLGNTALAELTARVDRQKIAVDETLTLVLRSNNVSLFDSPDLSVLEDDFKVLGSNRSSQHSIINGRSESSMEWFISLQPKRTGDLVIPPITLDDEESKALVVEVTAAKPSQQRAGIDPVFLEAEVSSSEVYVQSQLLLTLRVHYAVALARGAHLSKLEVPDAAVTELNETSYSTTINRLRYDVHEITYAVFPQRSGTMTIPSMSFSGHIATQRRSSFFNQLGARGKPVKVSTKPIDVKVKPQAASFSGNHWLPAQRLSLVESWSQDPDSLSQGEPVTRTIRIEAEGLLASQLPPLQIEEINGAQLYPDQAETEDSKNQLGVSSSRVESMAIIPGDTREISIAEVSVKWWNTRTGREEIAVLPARTLRVSGGSARPQPKKDITAIEAVPAVEGEDVAMQPSNPFWRYSTAGFALLWLITLGLLLAQRRRKTPTPAAKESSEQKAFNKLNNSLRGKKYAEIKQALLQWARAHRKDKTLVSLQQVASSYGIASLSEQLTALDAALYKGDDSNLDRTALKSALKDARKRSEKTKPEPLQPLYS
jgi:hypothetical protein